MLTWSDIRYFAPSEFDSPDQPGSGEQMMVLGFIKKLDGMRELINRPIRITSGFRTAAHNAKVGGSPNSAHTRGRAADLYTGDNSNLRYEILRAAYLFGFERIEIAPAHIHVDDDPVLPQRVAVFLPSYR